MKLRRTSLASAPFALFLSLSCAATPPASTASTASTAGGTSSSSGDAAIDAAAQKYLDLLVATSPETATGLGLHTHDTDLDDYSIAGFDATIAKDDAMLASLKHQFANPSGASLAKRIDLELLENTLDVAVHRARAEHPLERSPEIYLQPMNTLFLMIAREYAPADERAKNAVARLEKIPAILALAKANLKNPPSIWTQVGIEAAKQAGAFFDDVTPFLEKTLPADRARVDAALAAARAAYADYATFLEKDLLPRSKGDFAIGRERFDYLLHTDYALKEDADAIAAMGARVFDETEKQMTALAKKIDPSASGWPQVLEKVKLTHPTADDLIPSYKREVARARAFLVAKDAVPFPANDDCQVMETPPFQRSTTTAAYDQAPPFDTKTTRGFFFVTPVDSSLNAQEKEGLLRENNHAEQIDTVVHETYPGHHLQISFSRTHPALARKVTGGSNIFAEGWGLYSEELMSELGYYTDEERLAQLEWTLVRAARVLIDVGIQTKGMTFEQAVAILTDKVHLEKVLAVNEVKRYTASPTQPLSYLIGREKIFQMRDRMKQRDGAAFTLKKFHTEILSHASIAPGLLEEEMFGER